MSLWKELIVPGVVVVFGLAYAVDIHGLPTESTVFPYFLMILMPLLAVLIMLQEWRYQRATATGEAPDAAGEAAHPSLKAPLIVLSASVGYVALYAVCHFLIATFVYMVAVTMIFGVKPLKAAVIAAGIAGSFYVLFGEFFLVDL